MDKELSFLLIFLVPLFLVFVPMMVWMVEGED